MRASRSSFLAFALLALLAAADRAAADADFPYPTALRPQVEFWKKIFGVYSEHQVLIHDDEHLNRVYAVLDFRDLARAGESAAEVERRKSAQVTAEKERIRRLLLDLDARGGNDGGLSEEERKIWNLFAQDDERRKFASAASRLRHQHGVKERFGAGVRISRRYLAEMEEIFRREGLPVKLTRLPLIESCFNVDAYSKVGAAGIWQFMPATGRNYLTIRGVLDERRDPLRATRGAALHLKENHEMLGTWPLAITAYNHGRYGVARAVRTTGSTDIMRIVRGYRGPLFGFASRNFYAEFLAALEVESGYRTYFGDLTFDPPFVGDEVPLQRALSGTAAAKCADIPPEALAALNPAVDDAVFRGNGHLPRGYVLRVPHGRRATFQERLAGLPAEVRVASVAAEAHASSRGRTRSLRSQRTRQATYQIHRVARGQTLSDIARRYRVSVKRLKSANSLRGTTVRAGQKLKIPTG